MCPLRRLRTPEGVARVSVIRTLRAAASAINPGTAATAVPAAAAAMEPGTAATEVHAAASATTPSEALTVAAIKPGEHLDVPFPPWQITPESRRGPVAVGRHVKVLCNLNLRRHPGRGLLDLGPRLPWAPRVSRMHGASRGLPPAGGVHSRLPRRPRRSLSLSRARAPTPYLTFWTAAQAAVFTASLSRSWSCGVGSAPLSRLLLRRVRRRAMGRKA